MLRYKRLLRLGVLGYLLCLLCLLAGWTSIHHLTTRILDKASGKDSSLSRHTHGRNEGVLIIRPSHSERAEPLPVFAHRVYPSNHSHPVRAVPPVADSAAQGSAKGKGIPPCSVVREVEFYGQRLTLQEDPLCSWLSNPSFQADDHFVLYADKMALLYDVIVDPSRRGEGPKGGERMEEVWGQMEEMEYIKMKKGFFTLKCVSKPVARFSPKDHLHQWMDAVGCTFNGSFVSSTPRVEGLTIAVQRCEYANLYHTMTDFFNAFLAMLMFNQHPENVTILLVDAHPEGGLDSTWGALFGKVMRAGTLPSPTRFSALAWAAKNNNSPLKHHSRPQVAYLEEFRHFFLSQHGVDSGRKVNCSSLHWLFIWRRDYVAHPRNEGGSISRKIHNEDEVLSAVKEVAAPGDNVRGVQLDALPMNTQLQLISETDVLLGMHGAGLSHTLFLPPNGGLLEFYPKYSPRSNPPFRAMAKWRGLQYQTWQNRDSANEKSNHRTIIPPQVVVGMVKGMRKNICG